MQQSQTTTNQLSSERLRKAIERNRRKQAAKEQGQKPAAAPRAKRSLKELTNPSEKPAGPTRTYGVPDIGEVQKMIKDKVRRKKSSKAKSGGRFPALLRTFAWLFNGYLVVRLVFSANGVVDFYSMESNLEKLRSKIERLKTENIELTKEIRKIRTDEFYQKQLARDHLGVIAKDEYLIIFSEEK